ncbi:MAG: LptF/LptG family permease [Planctomycetes bacterium]|nr:LptF/LptG family permease [Planctomycetota bacterium]
MPEKLSERSDAESRPLPKGSRPQGVVLEARRRRLLLLRTFDRYLIRSFLFAYLICAVSFIGLYALVEAFTKVNRFIPAGLYSPIDIAGQFLGNFGQYLLAMVPTIYVNYMGPILTLAAAMFTLTQLNRTNEFTPIKACGISIFRAIVPIFFLAGGLAAWSFCLQEWVLPELREPIRRAMTLSRSGSIRPDPFDDPVYNLHLRAAQYVPDAKSASLITVIKWEADVKEVLDAEKMVWVPDPDSTPRKERGRWLIRNGSIQRWDKNRDLIINPNAKDFDRLKEPFQELWLESTLTPLDLETSDQDISYLSWRELREQASRLRSNRSFRVKLHHHFAFPFSHVILLFLGIPFVLNYQTRSFFLNLAVSFCLCAAYFFVSSMTLSLATDPGNLPPVVAAWLPNILFGSLGLTIFTNMRT